MGVLWSFLPDTALPLVFVVVALLLILRLITPRAAGMILGGLLLGSLLAPFLEVLFSHLPWWVSFGILLMIGISLVKGVLALFLGARAADHVAGSLAADLIRFLLRLCFAPFRLAFALAGRGVRPWR